MCMNYAGIEYRHGINVTIQSGSGPRVFHILMTGHLTDQPYVYSGICLNNGLYANTNHHDKHVAIYEIIKQIVDGTIGIEIAYSIRYPGQSYQPLISIIDEDPDLYKKFRKRMRNALSFEEYNNIRRKLTPLREKRKTDVFFDKFLAACSFLSILLRCIPIIYDSKDILLASICIKNHPILNSSKINYRRV